METIFGTLHKDGSVEEHLKVDVNKLPSSDPFAFGFGISSGVRFRKQTEAAPDDRYKTFEQLHGVKYREIAQEYLRGFLLGYKGILVKEGTKIRKGMERTLFHIQDNILNK
jgi:hypothetical protein